MAGRPSERDIQRGAALRRAREQAQRTQREAAERLDCSQPTITRIESGVRVPSPDEVRTLVAFYNPAPPLRDILEGTTSLADTPAPAALSPNAYFMEMLRAVDAADEILTFHSERTPMQLQSQQYALLQHRLAGDCIGETDVLRSLEQRRRIFTRENPPRYRALLTESSLLRMPGGSKVVTKQQAQYLLTLLDQYSRFSLQIIHMHAKLAFVDTDFTLLKMPRGQADVIYVPYGLDGRLIKDRRGVEEREAYWHAAQQAALSEDESRKFIHELAQHGKAQVI